MYYFSWFIIPIFDMSATNGQAFHPDKQSHSRYKNREPYDDAQILSGDLSGTERPSTNDHSYYFYKKRSHVHGW